MKLISFLRQETETWGAVRGDDVVDLGKVLGGSLADFIASPKFAEREKIVAAHKPDLKLAEIKFLPVIPRPEKIVCAVRNYLDHHNEAVAFGMKREITEFPPIFLRVWRSQVAPQRAGDPAQSVRQSGLGGRTRRRDRQGRPPHQPGRRLGSRRRLLDLQRRQRPRLATACAADRLRQEFRRHRSVRAVAGHADEIGDPTKLKLETRVNGATVQASNTSMLIFSIPRLIEYSSTIFDLVPGDVIATGTPAGVGFTRNPPVFLKPGDVVEVEIENIGVLRNPVVDDESRNARSL